MRGVALLAGRRQVLGQPLADRALPRAQHRRRPLRDLALGRRRRRQRLSHRSPVHMEPGSQGAHAQPLVPARSTDTFIQLHPRHLLLPFVVGLATTQRRDGGLGVGPPQTIEVAPSGATSECQTHVVAAPSIDSKERSNRGHERRLVNDPAAFQDNDRVSSASQPTVEDPLRPTIHEVRRVPTESLEHRSGPHVSCHGPMMANDAGPWANHGNK